MAVGGFRFFVLTRFLDANRVHFAGNRYGEALMKWLNNHSPRLI